MGRIAFAAGFIPAACIAVALNGAALADERNEHGPEAQEFIHGAPEVASEAWLLAAGGRIYDTWWDALDRPEPEGTHPSYPASARQEGPNTWRCKECHGWDYRGAEGIYAKGSHHTGFPGVMGAQGRAVEAIAAQMRDATHRYTPDMITDEEMLRVAAFISRGLVDMTAFIDAGTRKVVAGDLDRGREVFQTICAACHGYDGRMLDWGEDGEHNYVGTEAASLPDEVFNKISNAHPGVAMANLRALPLSDRIAVLAYAATLPTE